MSKKLTKINRGALAKKLIEVGTRFMLPSCETRPESEIVVSDLVSEVITTKSTLDRLVDQLDRLKVTLREVASGLREEKGVSLVELASTLGVARVSFPEPRFVMKKTGNELEERLQHATIDNLHSALGEDPVLNTPIWEELFESKVVRVIKLRDTFAGAYARLPASKRALLHSVVVEETPTPAVTIPKIEE